MTDLWCQPILDLNTLPTFLVPKIRYYLLRREYLLIGTKIVEPISAVDKTFLIAELNYD